MDIAQLHLHWGGASHNGKKYRSYSLAKSVRKNGKNSHKPIVKLGKLEPEDVLWWKNLLTALKNPSAIVTTFKDIACKNHFSYYDIAILNKFWHYWKLDDVFESNRKSDIAIQDIVKILTFNRALDPCSKLATTKWIRKTALPQILDVNPEKINKSRIFRDLQFIESKKEDICKHLLNQYKAKFPNDLKNIYYDLSSTTFSGSKCIISKYGHCKEGYQTHIVLALLVTENGLPFYWEVLPGGTADAKTISWLLQKCKNKFKDLDITAVFDRGFVADANLGNFESENIKYISAMDKNQIEGICDNEVKFLKFATCTDIDIIRELTDYQFFKENYGMYYKEIKVEHTRRYILCFNPQLFHDQRKAREGQIDTFINEIMVELNTELQLAQKSRSYESTKNKFIKYLKKIKINTYVDVHLTALELNTDGKKVNSFQGKVSINQEKKNMAMRLDGFWMLVTNLNEKNAQGEFITSSQQALKPYKDKVIIEDAFRDIKSNLEISPVHVWLENHVKAHYTICVLSYLINRTISNLLKESEADISTDIKTHLNVYNEFKDSSIDEIHIEKLKQSNFCLTILTPKQKEILKRLGAGSITKADRILEKFNK